MFVEKLHSSLAILCQSQDTWTSEHESDIQLDAALVEGLVKTFLIERFDRAVPIPMMHRAMWELSCSMDPYVAIAAPRGHAKSTSQTHSLTLAMVLFKLRDYVLIVSDTEAQAVSFLSDIKTELLENDLLIAGFRIKPLVKDTETEVICEMEGGHLFKIIGKGAEQKVRGLKWRGKRPNLIMVDDVENDELVLNKERREKFRNWFFNALLPCGSDDCIVRVVGTILHMDALLSRLLEDKGWTSLRLDAHSDDYSQILWGEKFPRARLEALRAIYERQNNPEGYAMEYRNQAIDSATAFFQKSDFRPLTPYNGPRTYYSAVDFAVSLKERSDYTVIITVEVTYTGIVRVVDVRRGHWDSLRVVDEMFLVQKRYQPEIFIAESGIIEKSIGPFLNAEMLLRDSYLNLVVKVPTKDKMSRAQAIKARMRAGGVEFDLEAPWFTVFQAEMLSFPRGRHDDQVDSLSWIGLLLDEIMPSKTPEEEEEEEYQEFIRFGISEEGRNPYTGY